MHNTYHLFFPALFFNTFEFLSNLFKIRQVLKTNFRMKVKIDTKEKFHVITIEELILSANMTGDLQQTLLPFLNKPIKNIIVNMQNVKEIDDSTTQELVTIQQTFYDANSSLVICNLKKEIEKNLDEKEFLELMNVTPTESEAWDIIQMEEIERELY